MSGPERVAVPRLTSRSGLAWMAGTVVLVLGVMAWVALTQPGNRWAVAVGAVLLGLATVWVLTRRIWLEPATGAVVRTSLWARRRVELGSARSVRLVDSRGGTLLLAVTDERTLYLPLLAHTDYVHRCQRPPLLRRLAEQIDTFAPDARAVATQLRGQADFLQAGGPLEQSPLVRLITHSVTGAAKLGGAGSLLD